MNKSDLRLDWCSHQAARFAVENWHYSKTMPVGKTAKIGVWECGKFIGVILFSNAVGAQAAKSLGLLNTELCELVRIALQNHNAPVSRMVRISISILHNAFPGLSCIVSFADPEQGHIGGIYQASNWVYVGKSTASLMYEIDGKKIHSRTANQNNRHFGHKCSDYDISNAKKIFALPKYKYLYPLSNDMRNKVEPMRQPYPKRKPSGGSADGGTAIPIAGGGSNPTSPLQKT